MMGSFFSLQNWQSLLKSDFNRGYLCALALVGGLIVILMILKFVWWLIFRERGCSRLTIRRDDGDVVVSRSAICAAIGGALKGIAALKVRKLRIFQRGKNYSITLLSSFDGSVSVAELVEKVKPLVMGTLRDTFGIDNVRRVKVVVEELDNEDDEDDEDGGDARRTAQAPVAATLPMPANDVNTGL